MPLPSPQISQQAPTGGTGNASVMQPMLGSGAQALAQVKLGVDALQKALVGLPMGSELHTAILKAVTDITRRMSSGDNDHAAQMQALMAMHRDTQQNPQADAMQRLFPQAGGQPQTPQMGG